MSSAAATLEARSPEHEIKLVTPALRGPVVAAWLRAWCVPDPQYPRGRVCSIYFDNREMASLRAKLNSDFLKRKVRIRCYLDHEGGRVLSPAFAEIKRKVGSRRFKARQPLDGDVMLLTSRHPPAPALRRFLRPLRDAGHLLEPDLHPFLRISFDRWRFIEPISGARVSLDRDIVAESVNPALLPLRHPLPLAHAVIEVKGPHPDLPRRLTGLRDFGARRESFSKYIRCYQRLTRQGSF